MTRLEANNLIDEAVRRIIDTGYYEVNHSTFEFCEKHGICYAETFHDGSDHYLELYSCIKKEIKFKDGDIFIVGDDYIKLAECTELDECELGENEIAIQANLVAGHWCFYSHALVDDFTRESEWGESCEVLLFFIPSYQAKFTA